MSAYQGYPQGQGPGGYDEGRARAPGNPPDGRYSKIETDPLVTSMAQSVPMSRVMPGTVETFKRPGQYSEEDFTGVPDAKRSCCKTGGLPVKGQGQAADWRCGMIDAADRPRTFFVFNLMLKTTAYDLFKYFVKFGDLKKFHVFNNDEGKSTGTGIVQYVRKEAAIAALAAQPHFIHKKKIIISHDRDPKKISTVIKSLEKHKLYVPNIPLHVSEEDLCEYFSQWGNILSCYVTEHAKRTSTKYGFISYTNYEDAVKCLNATHNYGQSVINVFVASNCKALRDAAKDSRNNAETNKLFVNYIPHEATADELKQHFSMWGKITFCSFEGKDKNNSRYGFVCYQELEDALKAMIMPHTLKHKKIFVSVAEKTNTQLLEASKDPKIMSAVGQKVQNCYLSVSNVNVNTTKEELYEYFKKYGSLASCAVKPAGLDEQIALLAYVKEVDAACCFRDDHFLNQRKLCLRWTDLTGWVPHKAEPPSRKLRISGLAAHTHSYTLMCYFSRLGRVEEFELVKDATLRPTGCAFVIFEKLGDAEKAVSNKPHVIDDKEIKVTYARHHENLPSETFPSWREQRPQETVQQQRLPESIKSLNQGYDPPEAREPRRLLEDAQPRRLVEDAQPRRLLEDAQPQRLLKDAQPQRLLEHTQPRRFVKDAQPQRLPEVYQPRRQSTQDPLMSRLTQVDSIPDMPLVAEYECNVSGCLFKGKSEQFDHHWTKIHEAKVLYLICSFCSMECVDADDFREHLDFFHGIEDRSEMSTFLLGARQEERDNIHFVMPGSVTRETCMKVTKPPQKKDAEDHLSGFHYLRCPKCPKSFMKKDFLLLHIKNKHQNTEMRTEEEPEAVEDNSEGSENLHFGSSPLERAYDEFQRQILPRSETDIPTISDIGSRSAGNRPMQTMPTSSLSAPLLSSQNVQRPQLPILPSQQPTPRSDPQLLASQVPTQQAVPFHGQVTPFYPSTASVPKPVPPPPRPPPVPLPPHQLYVGSQSYSYPRPPVSLFSNTSTRQPVVASRPAVSTQSFIVPPVSYSQVPFQPQVRAQSQQASVVASPHTQVVASVAPSVVPPTSPRAGAPLQLPQTGQVITQSVSVQPPEFVMEQPPVASQSVVMSSEDPSSIPERDAQDLKDFDMGNMTTQETSPESESEPEMVTEKKANDELRRSVQSGSVLALSPEWTKTLKIAHPKKVIS
ncbi:uncharacterized protein LOC124277861 [Haliotis rubra]|uniref:uncharacterized protein LOC124277861 n=1 Tax=Haliotis rubra TaxID=36100 RepID=UPI001EE5DB15|nr:uncharacterized protein LOC124277861 [Haliotis rubra]